MARKRSKKELMAIHAKRVKNIRIEGKPVYTIERGKGRIPDGLVASDAKLNSKLLYYKK